MIRWSDLPLEIQQRMLDEQERQGNPRNPDVFINYLHRGNAGGGMTWKKTKEGHKFWEEVLEGHYYIFFKRYPILGIKPEYLGLYKKTFKINRIEEDHKLDLDALKEKGLEHILL